MSVPYRIGQGYDLHRLVPGKPLWLGGIQVESPRGSEAHSDGDVLLHALIDALLGATGLGDIGDHFPPSDPQWKDVKSEVMLALVLEKTSELNFKVVNVDATVFLEAPKLYPYKASIREKLAELLSLSLDTVSLKAKTAEGFPPVGTSDAIAASVTLLCVKS